MCGKCCHRLALTIRWCRGELELTHSEHQRPGLGAENQTVVNRQGPRPEDFSQKFSSSRAAHSMKGNNRATSLWDFVCFYLCSFPFYEFRSVHFSGQSCPWSYRVSGRGRTWVISGTCVSWFSSACSVHDTAQHGSRLGTPRNRTLTEHRERTCRR